MIVATLLQSCQTMPNLPKYDAYIVSYEGYIGKDGRLLANEVMICYSPEEYGKFVSYLTELSTEKEKKCGYVPRIPKIKTCLGNQKDIVCSNGNPFWPINWICIPTSEYKRIINFEYATQKDIIFCKS